MESKTLQLYLRNKIYPLKLDFFSQFPWGTRCVFVLSDKTNRNYYFQFSIQTTIFAETTRVVDIVSPEVIFYVLLSIKRLTPPMK